MIRLSALLMVTTALAACGQQDRGSAPEGKDRRVSPNASKAHSAGDPHSGHAMGNKGSATAAGKDPHAGHQMVGAQAAADPHAGHDMQAGPAAANPHAGHQMPPRRGSSDPHSGHRTQLARSTADPHAGHSMAGRRAAADPHAGHGTTAKSASRRSAQAADPHAGHAMAAKPSSRRSAQADPHAGHGRAPTQPRPTDPHAGHALPAATPPSAQQPADPHAGHNMPAAPATAQADPHAGHSTTATSPADAHAGHNMPATPAVDPHAGHDMGTAEVAAPPVAPPPPAAFSGPAHAADRVFSPTVMAAAREELREEHGDMETSKVLIDQAELKVRDGRDGYAWDAQAWYGGDIDKAWVKTEGEGEFREGVEKAEVQALWSHAIDPWFDLQLGIRHDFRPDPQRTHLVAGVQGLAPYWFEVDGALFLSNKGDLTARFEGEYDLRLTQQLILQPRAEVDLALQDVPEIGIGSGLSSAELGARLRYEIRPEFAPYVGLEYERAFGSTARFSRARGEDVGGWSFLLGVRTWF